MILTENKELGFGLKIISFIQISLKRYVMFIKDLNGSVLLIESISALKIELCQSHLNISISHAIKIDGTYCQTRERNLVFHGEG